MYQIDDKRRLYQLMEMYLSNSINANTFCDEFYYSYDLNVDFEKLNNLEKKLFGELSVVSGRFSDIKEDLEEYPGTYFTEKELHDKVKEVYSKLTVN